MLSDTLTELIACRSGIPSTKSPSNNPNPILPVGVDSKVASAVLLPSISATKLLPLVIIFIVVAANHSHMDDYHEKISGYFDQPWNWDSIKQNQQWIVQFSSLDDPYIPIHEARHINSQLDSEYYEYDNHGHFGEDIFKTEFPEIITVIRQKLA